MIRLACEPGLRRGEVARCRRDDLIGEPGRYSLRVLGKGNKLRVVPITDALAAAIMEHCAAGRVASRIRCKSACGGSGFGE